MKNILVITFTFLLLAATTKAQKLERSVVANGGDFFSNSSSSLSWTLGETAVAFLTGSSGNTLSEGFQQAYSTVTSVPEIKQDEIAVFAFPNPAKEKLHFRLE